MKGITAPIATGGRITLDAEPTIITLKESGLSIAIEPKTLQRQAESLSDLTAHMPRASCGLGTETIQDANIRDALQIKADDFDVNIPQDTLESIKDNIRDGLELDTDIMLEPYGLNVYEKGGRFVQHKDTPRGNDMLGTLVICLPSLFTGGDLELAMGKETHRYFTWKAHWDPNGWEDNKGGIRDWWENGSSHPNGTILPWCAFFADVDHEIKTVKDGVRVTLTYLIRRTDHQDASDQRPREIGENEQAGIVREELEKALRDHEQFLPSGGTIGFPCVHLYTNEEVFPEKRKGSSDPLTTRQISSLKGRDKIVAYAAKSCNLEVYLVPYLSHSEAGDIAPYRLKRFPKERRCPKRMDEDDVKDFFKGCHLHDGEFNEKNYPWNQTDLWILQYGDKEQAEQDLGYCGQYNYEGYYGNEAGDTTFYVKAALHIKVPDSFHRKEELAAPANDAKEEETTKTE